MVGELAQPRTPAFRESHSGRRARSSRRSNASRAGTGAFHTQISLSFLIDANPGSSLHSGGKPGANR